MTSIGLADQACGVPAGGSPAIAAEDHRRIRAFAQLWGVGAALGLLGVYLGLVGWANSFQHAFGELLRLWYWMFPLVGGFGLQVGLFVYGRKAARAAGGPNASGVMASGGTGTVSMAACCAHHLTDVLPVIGLAGTGLFLSAYQELFLLVGVVSNAMGVLYLLSVIGRHRLAPAEGSVLSALPALPWRRVLITGSAVSGLVLATGLWISLV